MGCKITALPRDAQLIVYLAPKTGFFPVQNQKTTRMSQPQQQKPVIGVSVGDVNGIGTELIIKAFSDHRLLEFCTPLIFASNKLINFYRKFSPETTFNYQSTKDFTRIAPKQINMYNCWEEEIAVVPGQLADVGGNYAVKSLTTAVEALKERKIQA